MKKILILLLVLIIGGASGYYYLYSKPIPSKDLYQLTITDMEEIEDVLLVSHEKDRIDSLVETLNSGKKIGMPTSFDKAYRIDIAYSSKDSRSYELAFNMERQEVTLLDLKSHKYYVVDSEKSYPLFTAKFFSGIYPYAKGPTVALIKNDSLIEPVENALLWQYKTVAEEWASHQSNGASLGENTYAITDTTTSFKVDYSLPPITSTLQVLRDESIVFESSIEDNHFLPYLQEGTYTYKIISEWASEEYTGQQELRYNISLNLPPRFRLSKTTATAGDFIVVYADYVDDDEKVLIDQNLIKWTPTFFNHEGTRIAFIPLNYYAKTGQYKIHLWTDKNSETADKTTFDVGIKYKDFKKQYLYIDETIEKSTRNQAAYSEYNKYFKPTRETITMEKLWEGPFIAPVEGRISTEFGEMRYVNDALTSYRHSGTDYAVPKGTPVKAPNRGRVNLSMFLTLTGNTVVIDHGFGLFTVYFHLDSLNVEKNQMVHQGDIIGTVGSTGFSTGPHLHYTTSIGKTNFDTLLLTGTDPYMP